MLSGSGRTITPERMVSALSERKGLRGATGQGVLLYHPKKGTLVNCTQYIPRKLDDRHKVPVLIGIHPITPDIVSGQPL